MAIAAMMADGSIIALAVDVLEVRTWRLLHGWMMKRVALVVGVGSCYCDGGSRKQVYCT